MTERIDATNTTEHMADAESTAESAKAAVRGVEETHPEYVDFTVDDFPGGLPACLEAILMVADQPQTATELARILALDRNTVEEALQSLHDDYEGDESRDIRPRGFELRRTARGWQFASRAAFEPVVSSFVTDGQTARLSQAALEALLDLLGVQPAPITAKWFIFIFMSAGLILGALMLLLAFRHGRYWTAFSLSQER